ncbi:hypothetical protein GX48_07789 [Paracoccidioides brasiliensis]|nr:hypothetical protein GX48_07789 [Paracoccidioides brasiliensis]
MVFSPCPRSQRSKFSNPKAADPPIPNSLSPPELPPRFTSAVANNLSEERLAFEAIFRSSTSRTNTQSPQTTPDVQQFPRTTVNRTKHLNSKASRLSLAQLSHKIRRRLSRESHVSRKSSMKFKEHGVSQHGAASQDADLHTNSIINVDFTTTGDAEYDSDARCIGTPQITECISSGISGVLNNTRMVLSNTGSPNGSLGMNRSLFPTGFDGTASGMWDEATGQGFDGFNDRFHTSPCSLTSPGFAPISISSSSNCIEDIGNLPSGQDADNLPRAPRLESPLYRFSWESNWAPRIDRQPLAPASQRLNYQRILPDFRKSRTDSPTPGFEPQVSQFKEKHTVAGSNTIVSTSSESFYLLNNEQSKSLSNLSAPVKNLPAGQQMIPHTQSRFIEDFSDNDRCSSCASDPIIRNSKCDLKDTRRSFSDGWLSDGKRRGYGYRFVEEADEYTSNSVQQGKKRRAIEEYAAGVERVDPSNLPGEGLLSPKYILEDSRRLHSDSTAVCQQSDASNNQGYEWELGCEGMGSQVRLTGLQKNGNDCVNSHKKFFSSWARFPSHNKNAKSQSAGHSDNVVARDFATQQPSEPNSDKKSGPMPQAGNDKTVIRVSVRKSSGMFNWIRLHRSDTIDRRRYRAGFRRDASRSNDLRDPDLEIIPGGPTGYPIFEQIGDIRLEVNRHKQRMKAQTPVVTPKNKVKPPLTPLLHPEDKPDLSAFNLIGLDSSIEPGSADGWSRLYDDCIGTFSDEDLFMSCSSKNMCHGVDVSKGTPEGPIDKQKSDKISTSMDLRNSTMEFKEEQLVNEVASRDRLLKLVERAWGQ